MFFTGIFIITARAIPDGSTIPYFYLGRIETAIGYLPWFVAYLDRYLIFSMTYDAMLNTIIVSILVGINIAFLAYRFGFRSRAKSCKTYKGTVGLFGLAPAFLSLFACCGGGILVMIFGAGIIATLFPYAYVFGLTSIAVLSVGILFSARDLEKRLTVIN